MFQIRTSYEPSGDFAGHYRAAITIYGEEVAFCRSKSEQDAIEAAEIKIVNTMRDLFRT